MTPALRFELEIEGHTALVTYRKSPDAITLVHTEVPPELGGKGVGSKLARATLDAVRAQGAQADGGVRFHPKLHVQARRLQRPAGARTGNGNERRTYKAGCFCGAVEVEASGAPVFAGYCHCADCQAWSAAPVNAFSLWKSSDVRVTKGASDIGTYNKTENPLPEILQGLRRPCHDRASAHAADRCLRQSAARIYAPADPACELRKARRCPSGTACRNTPTSLQTSAAPERNCRIEFSLRRVGKGALAPCPPSTPACPL